MENIVDLRYSSPAKLSESRQAKKVFSGEKKKRSIRIPDYTLGEELFNSISHGFGAFWGIAALVLMCVKANGILPKLSAVFFGISIIQLYTISCIYHALSPRLKGKKVLRVIDHCNVYLLVWGTYFPVALLGVKGWLGWLLLSAVFIFSILGIVFTAIDVDRFQLISVICHLLSGWSILFGVPKLLSVVGLHGLLYLILGGVMYSIGAVLYGLGKKKRYRHSVFHVFCLLGTFFHFWCVYAYLL